MDAICINKLGDQLFGLIWLNNFTNSSRKGLLYVQVVYKYFVILQVEITSVLTSEITNFIS
jgi:hypothetical protein